MVSQQHTPSIIYCDRNMSAAVSHRIAGGEAVVFSSRCPEKVSANEDAAAIVPFGQDACVLIVADGMGGHSAGEVASRTAIREMIAAITQSRDAGDIARMGIINGFERANDAVQRLGSGAGTTLAVVEVAGDEARPYHAGDTVIVVAGSRGKIKLETTSHSPVGFGLAAGFLNSDEAMDHEDRHLVLNAIGSATMRIEIGSPVKLAPRDTILLASDGLTDNVTLGETIDFVRRGKLRAATDGLTALAANRMREPGNGPSKPDDLTVLLFRRALPRPNNVR